MEEGGGGDVERVVSDGDRAVGPTGGEGDVAWTGEDGEEEGEEGEEEEREAQSLVRHDDVCAGGASLVDKQEDKRRTGGTKGETG